MNRLRSICIALTASIAIALSTTTAPPSARAEAQPSVMGQFEGHWIRLTDDWGEAGACASDGTTARCYRTEEEMNRAEGFDTAPSLAAACSQPGLRLYRSTSWGGGVLAITTQYTYISLAPHGFDNDTSSYRVGACTSYLYDGSGGTGLYPGNTTAGASAPSMLAGWDNRISSVYLG